MQLGTAKIVGSIIVLLILSVTASSYSHNAFADDMYSFVTKWGSFGSGNSQFNIPAGMASDNSGDLYVVDQVNSRVQKFSSLGAYITEFDGSYGSGNNQFISGEGIAFDSLNNYYVVDQSNHRVQKFSSSGTFQGWIGNCISGTNCDTTNHVTTGFCSNCVVLGSGGSGDGQFNIPFAIVFDKFGNIYVTDENNHRVQKFDSAGVYQSQFGSGGSGDGQFNVPSGIAFDSFGDIYVSDTFNNRIEKFSSNGGFLSSIGTLGSGDGQLHQPNYIALDNLDNIYVADTANARIEIFSPSGAFLSHIGSIGSGDGQFGITGALVFDKFGNIYVVDTENNRIEKFALIKPVGGSGMPIDTTSFLLAGVQGSALWMIPAIVFAGAGITIFKLRKKKGKI